MKKKVRSCGIWTLNRNQYFSLVLEPPFLANNGGYCTLSFMVGFRCGRRCAHRLRHSRLVSYSITNIDPDASSWSKHQAQQGLRKQEKIDNEQEHHLERYKLKHEENAKNKEKDCAWGKTGNRIEMKTFPH